MLLCFLEHYSVVVVDYSAVVPGSAFVEAHYHQIDSNFLEHEKNISQNQELLKLKGVIVTPHIAFYADDSMKKMYSEAFTSIKRYLKKEKLIHRVLGE